MNLKLSDLWRWEGTIDRGPYALIGVIGFVLKHNLDRFIASFVFHRPWDIFNYWIPPGKAIQIGALSKDEAAFLMTMVAMALPFIWVGVVLTLKRLRAARLPSWLVTFFFVPFLNLIFFLLLSILPSQEGEKRPKAEQGRRPLDRLIPDHPIGSSAMAVLLTVLTGVAMTQLGVKVFSTYGWGLFVGLPFCLGLLSVLLYGYHQPRSYAGCLSVSLTSVLLLGVALLTVAVEGLICLVMAAPIAAVLAVIGGSIGYVIQRRPLNKNEAPSMLLVLILLVPSLMGAEYVGQLQAPLLEVRTAIEIDASPKQVWGHVVSFSELPEPKEWIFRHGIAYPVRAKIYGKGIGAQRHCVFSTGSFIEPIEVWDEPRLLKFGVTENPPPMQEWTPYRNLHPPHLDGFLVSERGQFLLAPLTDGRTRLEGTTWYRHHMWPASYWQIWADLIVHQIHVRVLRHIKTLAESG